jgi:phosphohistidine phosphatase
VVAVRELILMRHAAALAAAVGASDFGRPLSEPGRLEAAQSARRLAGTATIERILFSPARRTSETAQIVAGALSLDPQTLVAVPALYAATPAAIRIAVSRNHDGACVLLLVGHNPGISEFGCELAGLGSHAQLPTAGFWRRSLGTQAWQALTNDTDPELT